MMFDGGGAGPAEHPGGATASGASKDRQQQQTPVLPFSGGHKPTPRSVRIVSMQDSNAATTATGAGTGGRRELGTDRTTTTRVSSSASATFPPPLSVYGPVLRKSAIGGLLPTLFSSSQTPDARLRAAIATPPKFRSPGLHLELLHDPSCKQNAHPILPISHPRPRTRASSDVPQLQRCLHLDRVSPSACTGRCLRCVLLNRVYL
jgi:hypothetical protein